jgi:hypothetical protein
MPRRVDSDEEEEEDSKPKRKKANPTKKPRTTTSTKSPTLPKKTNVVVSKEHDSATATWAKRRTVESLDGIEDVDAVSPRKERRKPAFEIDDGKSFACSGADSCGCRFGESSPTGHATCCSQKEGRWSFQLVEGVSSPSEGGLYILMVYVKR